MSTFISLAPQARTLFYLQSASRLLLFWFPVILGAGFAGAFLWAPAPALSIMFGVLFVRVMLSLWWPHLSWRRWGWLERDEELLIARGVLFRSITAIPVTRVQHIDVRQGPLEQWLGLARVYVHTASGLGADGVIPGLLRPVAEGLRDRLVRTQADGDDGV